MILHCIRHGVTAGNIENRFNGATEDTLTAEQVAALEAIAFASSGYDAIYCSPKRRCQETAAALKITGWSPEPRIVERHFGMFEGRTFLECRDQHPDEFAALIAFDAEYQIPNGESRGQHLARVMHWLEEAAGKHGKVLAITHGGTIDFLYRLSGGAPLHGGRTMHAGDNAALSVLEIEWPTVKLIEFSRKL